MHRVTICLCAMLLLCPLAPKAWAEPALTQAQIDRYNALFTEGANAVGPYLVLRGRESAPLNAAEVHRGIALLDEAIEIHPGSWQAWLIKGKALEALNDRRASFEAIQQAYAIDPHQQMVVNELTIGAMELGEFTFALDAVQRGLAEFPDDLALTERLALVLLMLGRLDESIAMADRALQLAPNNSISLAIRQVAIDLASGRRPQPRSMSELHNY
jgi:tetratricopeptide (TPR) repeat protein